MFAEQGINTNSCVNCDSACLQCSDSETCSSCRNPSQVLLHGLCLGSCPLGYLPLRGLCTACPENCNKCDASACLECGSAFLHASKCVTACPPAFFPVLTPNTCAECKQPCLNCLDLNVCTSCRAGVLFGTECL
jgi:hypothetical protein